jgi:hypothetical protein
MGMKKTYCFIGVLFIGGFFLYAQEIPEGVKMGMNYSQIKPLMQNGKWETLDELSAGPDVNFYGFTSENFGADYIYTKYIFGIHQVKGLAWIKILSSMNLIKVVRQFNLLYGPAAINSEKDAEVDMYVWGINKELPSNILFINAKIWSTDFSEIDIFFKNFN